MGCALAVCAYAFIMDPYLFCTPKEWLVGAFGLTCSFSFTCLYIKLADWYVVRFKAPIAKVEEDQEHLRAAMNAVNEEGKRAKKGSDHPIPQFGRAACVEEEKGDIATPKFRPGAYAEHAAYIEHQRRGITIPKFGHAVYIHGQDDSRRTPIW